MVIFIYGLDGSGKTTLSQEVRGCFPRCVILDGEEVNAGLNKNSSDKLENIRRVAETAKLLSEQGILAIIAEECATEEERNIVKDIIGEEDLFTVYLSTPLEVCKERSSKYGNSDESDESEVVAFEPPAFCNLMIDTSNRAIKDCLSEIIREFDLVKNKSDKAYKKYEFYNMKEDMWRLNYKYKYATPIIAKCASTQIKAWCDDDNTPYRQEYLKSNPDIVPNRRNRDRFGVVNSSEIPEDFTKFAVYRDPLERFNSACHFPGYDAKKVMEEFTNYTYEDGVCKDQHMRRQSDFYKVEDVDYIVKLSDLNDFLKEVFDDDVNMKRKIEHPVFTDVDMTLTEKEQEELRNYYLKDWDIEKSDKVWVNPNQDSNK